jgi:hypothetical protein
VSSRSVIRIAYIVAVATCLSACAGVTVKSLSKDGTASAGEDGVRYYRPQPYLFVAALPPTPTATSQEAVRTPGPQDIPADDTPPKKPKKKPNANAGGTGASPGWNGPDVNGPRPGAAGDTTPKDTTTKKDDPASATPPAASSTSDLSFAASTPQYSMRLVYLPDYSHPLSMSMHSGLFGTASFAPMLQDGWMLSSLQASGDNKVAETLTAVASIIAATHGGGAAATGGGKDKGGAPGGVGPDGTVTDPVSDIINSSKIILKPGLYRFQYNEQGQLSGFCAVAYFSGTGATANKGCDDKSPADAVKPKPR